MKKVIILLVLMSLMSCGHYRWFIKHRKELCCCDTLETVIYRQAPVHYWNYTPEDENMIPYNYKPYSPIILDSTLIIGYDTIQLNTHPGTYPVYRGY